MGEWNEMDLDAAAIINPTESLNNGVKAKKIAMTILQPFTKKVPSYSIEEYHGGMKFRNGDTLVARITPCLENGKTVFVDILDDGEIGFGSTEYIVLREKQDVSDKHFLYYFAISQEFRDVAIPSMTGSSGRQRVQTYVVRNHLFSLPPLPEQKAIASVLSSLDDKIDLLHRQNKTLEAMSETLFRQWFVEETQVDWEEIVITDLFEIRDGTHDSPKQSPAGKPLITSKHIGTNRLDIKNTYLISEDDFYNVNKRSKVETNDILFSMIGTIGLTYLEQTETVDYAIKNIGLFKTSQNPDWRYYTFLWINSSLGKEFIHEYRSGSTQEYIALGSLRSIVFDAPPLSLLLEFNKVIHTYFEKIKNNMLQIRTLEKLRDTVLPKLMSGEVRVEV